MEKRIERRDIALSLILSIITCGIYGIIWFVNLTNDVKTASKDETLQSGIVALLLTIVTCGIYSFYWAYKMGKAMSTAKINNGLNGDDNAILYLILEILGLGIVTHCLIQNDLNSIATKEK